MEMNSTTQTQHTPGPWEVIVPPTISGDSRWVMGPDEKPIAQINWGREQDERFANARLIASAPDLLAALEAADEVLAHEGYQDSQPVRASIRLALARARGL